MADEADQAAAAFAAVASGNSTALLEAIAAGANPDTVDPATGKTLRELASEGGLEQALLDGAAFAAVASGDADALRAALLAGASLDAVGADGKSLRELIAAHEPESERAALQAVVAINSVRSGAEDELRVALFNGANPDTVDPRTGKTLRELASEAGMDQAMADGAAMRAVRVGDAHALKAAIIAGADLSAENAELEMSLGEMVDRSENALLRQAVESGLQQRALVEATQPPLTDESRAAILAALRNGANYADIDAATGRPYFETLDPEMKAALLDSALFVYASEGDETNALAVRRLGGNPNAVVVDGQTAVDVARGNGHVTLADRLASEEDDGKWWVPLVICLVGAAVVLLLVLFFCCKKGDDSDLYRVDRTHDIEAGEDGKGGGGFEMGSTTSATTAPRKSAV